MFSLKNKVVVLFGGNGYLGKHFCQTLLKNGAILYNCDINTSEDELILKLRKKYSDRYNEKTIDAGDLVQLKKLYNEIIIKHERIDVLINLTLLITNKNKYIY